MQRDPFASYGHVVPPEWIDSYDHMNMARYVELFDRATDEILGEVGLGPRYTARTRHGLFTVDVRIRYLEELRLGMSAAVRLRLVGCDHVRLHMWLEMFDEATERLFATQEQLSLHASLERRKAVPFSAEQRARLDEIVAVHRREPQHASRSLCMRCKGS
jgi:acyl-CoA thioester hydrolase